MVSSSMEPETLMGVAECLHAQLELSKMGWMPQMACKEVKREIERLKQALEHHAIDDLIRFDPKELPPGRPPLTQAGYCRLCGKFAKLTLKQCPEEGCEEDLYQEVDFESLTEAVVWTSVFQDIGLDPLNTATGQYNLNEVLKMARHVRPYQSLVTLGWDSYLVQGYFLTHLLFIMSHWGRSRLCRSDFPEECIFLHTNLPLVVKLRDCELVGEYCHALHLLGYSTDNCPVLKEGICFLLKVEKKNGQGTWMPRYESVFKRYHAAYCALIGISEMAFLSKDRQPLRADWKASLEAVE
eukprot:g32537.t1